MPSHEPGPTLLFRSAWSRVLAVAVAALAVFATVDVMLNAGVRAGLGIGLWAALAAVGMWLAFWRPYVKVSDGGIDIHNILTQVHVPWPAYRSVSHEWSLTVHTTTRTVTAWSAPRAGAWSRLRAEPPRTSAEAVADAIAERHHALSRAGYLTHKNRPGQPQTQVTWDIPAIIVLVSLAAAAAVMTWIAT